DDGQTIVKPSVVAPGIGVSAPVGANVENNWWGQTGGPSGQLSGGVTVSAQLGSQRPTATISVTGKPSVTQTLNPVNSGGALGTGLVEATVPFSRDLNPEATQPNVSYASTPVLC